MPSFLERKGRTKWYSNIDRKRNLSPVPLLNTEDRLSFARENAITFIFSIYKQPVSNVRTNQTIDIDTGDL
jgi:hypothetical protein